LHAVFVSLVVEILETLAEEFLEVEFKNAEVVIAS
jgi:hypothetical protein